MNANQYRRANKRAYIILMIILVYLLGSLVVGAVLNGFVTSMIAQIAVHAAAIVISTIVFISLRSTRVGMILMMAAGAASYVVVALLNRNEYAFIYAFVFIVMSMCFYNLRLVVLGNVVVIITNIIRLIMNGDFSDSMAIQEMLVVMITLVLVAVASISVIRLLMSFNKENMESLQAAADLQAESNEKMLVVADKVTKQFAEAMDTFESLRNSIEANNFAMQNIASGETICFSRWDADVVLGSVDRVSSENFVDPKTNIGSLGVSRPNPETVLYTYYGAQIKIPLDIQVDGLSIDYIYPGVNGELPLNVRVPVDGVKPMSLQRVNHPVEEGFVQKYTVGIFLGQYATYQEMMKTTWRHIYPRMKDCLADISNEELFHNNMRLLKKVTHHYGNDVWGTPFAAQLPQFDPNSTSAEMQKTTKISLKMKQKIC